MRIYDIITKKRDKQVLTKEEITYFVNQYASGNIPDYQASALLMAIYLNEMNTEETANLTLAMMHSGDVIDLSKIQGIKVDKHSTGGVGDKTSIALGPMIAACGVPVAKLSGRGLGHTGGTLDKLEAFKGFNFELSEEKFTQSVNDISIAIAGQTANLVPADKKIYALRDVTATVSNKSLISASIMSKKLASGADAIVLDVKCGDGGFMKDYESAKELANIMVRIGDNVGRKTVAIISNMDQPLGNAIGNSLEVIEAIETLKGKGSKELLDLCLELGAQMLILGGKASSKENAIQQLLEVIHSGKAIQKLKDFVQNQGGDISCIDNYSKFPQASIQENILATESGFVHQLHAENIGLASLQLGAGRETKESNIDLSAGIYLHKKIGDKVEKNEVLATIYTNKKEAVESVKQLISNNYTIAAPSIEQPTLIMGFVE